MELIEAHKAQISRYVTFFKGKRERMLSDRGTEKDDFVCDRLADDAAIYNNPDVTDLVENYHAQTIGAIRESVEEMINQSAVYIAQLFAQAEQAGFALDQADICAIEDQNRVAQIQALAAAGMAPMPAAQNRMVLPTVGAAAGPDPAMVAKVQELEAENLQMRDRYQNMQTQVSGLLADRSQLSQELEVVKQNFAQVVAQMEGMSAGASHTQNVAEIQHSLQQTEANLYAKQAECDQMRNDLNARLGDSNQFKELKAIVKKKSDEVKLLRQRLAEHGLPFTTAQEGVELAPEDD